VSPRASLPGAEELFRRTSPERKPAASRQQESKSTNLQVAKGSPPAEMQERKGPKHEEKVTFYCTPSDLLALDGARLKLRGEHGIAADRGRIVRAALSYVLEDFEARSEDSILLRRLSE
jgi:hypothetical protein